MTPIPFRDALRFWLKLGFISFGGPAGQIAVMHAELVERRRWISERRFLHALNYCMLLPGPEAQQLATYIGWLMHRTAGGIVAGVLFVLPSLLLLVALAWLYVAFGDLPAVEGVLRGVKPAVTAIVAHAAWRLGTRTLGNPALWALAAGAFAAIFLFDVPFPAIVAAAALAGVVGARWRPAWFAAPAAHGPAGAPAGPAVIDDATPLPPHARFDATRTAAVVAAGLALWAGPMLALAAAFGWQGTLTQMAWFFTKAALLTFGGAYAVLPYVWQGAVERHAWATPAQMIDGLALGETTPGPLIMVVAFVGFVGGWGSGALQAATGASPAVAGAAAAVVVTWFTFLPSFVFILAGAPLVEATQGRIGFTAPLRAITAAVVGVIVNLAVFFAWHVFWPGGGGGRPDVVALALAAAAAIALFRFRRGVVETILACGLAGLLVQAVWPAPAAAPARAATAVVPGDDAGVVRPTAAFAGTRVHDTPHFRIATTATDAQTREIAAGVDALHAAWREAVALPPRPGEPRRQVRLYGDRAEFRRHNRSQPWAEAYYVDGVAYAYYDVHGRNRLHWTLHEVVHQLNREAGGWRLPKWANEGLATYLSASVLRDGVLRPGEIDPTAYPVFWLDTLRLGDDRAADAAAGRFIPLRVLITGEGGPPLAASVNLHYVHWWSFAHYLMHGEGGRHADGFRRVLRTRGTLEDVERLIGPVDALEAGWHAWMRELALRHRA